MEVLTFDLVSGVQSTRPYTQQEVNEISCASSVSAADAIKMQIAVLESNQTARRIREAALGIDGGWLFELNAQIEFLRRKLHEATNT